MSGITKPSVQSLILEMFFGGQRLSLGTGFLCDCSSGPVLLTNWHNVSGRNPFTKELLSSKGGIPDRIKILHNQAGKLGSWVWRTEALYTDQKPNWIEHPELGDKADFIALPLTQIEGIDFHPYDTNGGLDIALMPADTISVVGFPFGLQAGGSFAVWTTGFVASEPSINFNELPIFLIDCRTRPGQSGSAVIFHRNGGTVAMRNGDLNVFQGPVTRFLGIYSGRINEESDLGIVWKASAVTELLASI